MTPATVVRASSRVVIWADRAWLPGLAFHPPAVPVRRSAPSCGPRPDFAPRLPPQAARLLVEQLDDRCTPSAVSLGLDNLNLAWLGRQQQLSFASDFYQCRELGAARPAVTLLAPAPSGNTPLRHDAIVIDASVPDLRGLVRKLEHGLAPGAWYDLYTLDDQHDGLEQIDAILRNYQHDLDALHLVSHGEAGGLQIGSGVLDLDKLRADGLPAWQQAFTRYGDLLLYGCDVAAGPRGEAFVQLLHQLTGADVAASTDLSGSADLGGDWNLEFHAGQVDAASLAPVGGWTGLLLAPTGTGDSYSTNEDTPLTINYASAGLNAGLAGYWPLDDVPAARPPPTCPARALRALWAAAPAWTPQTPPGSLPAGWALAAMTSTAAATTSRPPTWP